MSNIIQVTNSLVVFGVSDIKQGATTSLYNPTTGETVPAIYKHVIELPLGYRWNVSAGRKMLARRITYTVDAV